MEEKEASCSTIPNEASPINVDYQHDLLKETTPTSQRRRAQHFNNNDPFEKRATNILKQLHESSVAANQALS
jgi:hypothetical protein